MLLVHGIYYPLPPVPTRDNANDRAIRRGGNRFAAKIARFGNLSSHDDVKMASSKLKPKDCHETTMRWGIKHGEPIGLRTYAE